VFPNPESKAGARAFPLLIPLSPDQPAAQAGARVIEALRGDGRPTLTLWGDSDPIIPPETGRRFAEAIGRAEPELVEGASHFLQEDRGDEVGRRIADWLTS
jgi:haloalkane dehalogenase